MDPPEQPTRTDSPRVGDVPGMPTGPAPVPAVRDEPPAPRARRPGVRPTQAQRERVATQLREAFVDDRLTLDEYSDRLSVAYHADSDAELAELVEDLPAAEEPAAAEPERAAPPAARPASQQTLGERIRAGIGAVAFPLAILGFFGFGLGGIPDEVAIMGGTELTSQQVLDNGGEVNVATLMGGAEIDLTDLQPGDEVTIDGASVMGGMNIEVDPGTRVNMGGLAIMGGRSVEDLPAADPDGPVVNVSVNALMGGVSVGPPDLDDD